MVMVMNHYHHPNKWVMARRGKRNVGFGGRQTWAQIKVPPLRCCVSLCQVPSPLFLVYTMWKTCAKHCVPGTFYIQHVREPSQ